MIKVKTMLIEPLIIVHSSLSFVSSSIMPSVSCLPAMAFEKVRVTANVCQLVVFSHSNLTGSRNVGGRMCGL